MTLDPCVFNLDKGDYERTPLFLGEPAGLLDSLNKKYPQLWSLYKKLKALDWDENEFNYTSCIADFKTCSKSTYDLMIKSLAWQWESDSVAARMVGPVGAQFTSCTELQCLWQQITGNEMVHALTYSEIVKNSFEDPDVIFKEILSIKEAHARLATVSKVFESAYLVSHKLALSRHGAAHGITVEKQDTEQDIYNVIFMYVAALYMLERVQFIASFAVTFAICETGLFMPIGEAVKKICQEEYEIHAVADRRILEIEMSTPRGKRAVAECKDSIEKMLNEVIESEKTWLWYAFSEGRELPGVTKELLFSYTLFSAKEIYEFFDLTCPYEIPQKNPLRFMDSWLDISDIQGSPQEARSGAYMLGSLKDTSTGKSYEI